MDQPTKTRLRDARDAALYAEQLEEIPDWPVTWKNLIRLVGSFILALLSIDTQLFDIITTTLN